ncbi:MULTISPECIES: MFS transporter [Aerococcus]|uniref:MFS transporter n=1 Tax=Aerococcus TaxID=1375 RepID=UPI0018A7BCCA|nr:MULTISPECIES: MFS transporter [Aerococcus]MCY3036846.1 MFS transporter [Aerococcus sp. Group 2]MCY3040081.1 MFS transporter [Aerococcus sp. Group 2]MCY3041630.1 MFS transporter [Aerococcus sp. Group 2]MCY3043474.1 MFS transporter [Aerococcus sp. Group 2]MDK6521298.1 MFS transporter [Aerococcus urinae]
MNLLKNKNIRIYLLSIFLTTISYALPHSILTVLLLAKGVSLSQIALIQMAYSGGMILSEFPSGVISDLWSRKSLYLLSKVLLIVMFCLVLFTSNFWTLALAWFTYGIASAFDSGTLDSEIIVSLKESDRALIPQFVSIDNNTQTFALLLGSVLGSFLYFKINIFIYLLAILLTGIAIFLVYCLYQENPRKNEDLISINTVLMKEQIRESFSELMHNAKLRKIFCVALISQIFFQTHFQLWQAFLLEKSVKEEHFIFYYVIFQIITMVAYSVPIDQVKERLTKRHFSTQLLILIMVILPFLLLSKHFFLFSSAYIIFVFLFFLIEYMVNSYFNDAVSEDNISSLVSLKSTVSRLFSMLCLLAMSLLLNRFPTSLIVSMSFLISILLLLGFYYWSKLSTTTK